MSENKQTQMSMDDHELLMHLAKSQKTAMWHRRIIAYVEVLILILLVAAMLIVGPRLIRLTDEMASTLERVNRLVDSAEPAIQGLSSIHYDELNQSLGALGESVDQFSSFVSKISSFGGLFR